MYIGTSREREREQSGEEGIEKRVDLPLLRLIDAVCRVVYCHLLLGHCISKRIVL